MNSIAMKARAKINLYLDVLARRDDGYHDLIMIMQSLALYDSIFIKKVHKPNYLKLVTNLPWLPCDERNLAHKAASYLIKRFNISDGIFIELHKVIPASAGLGGGSADCAAVLVGMRNLFDLPMSNDDLIEIGLQFGADVPFCVKRGCALAEGIGDRLTALPPAPAAHVLLVRPPVPVSTAEIFRSYAKDDAAHNKSERHGDVNELQKSISRNDFHTMASQLYNALEPITAKKHPIILDIKSELIQLGAAGAMMSGSGPTVFGLFDNFAQADAAKGAIKEAHPNFTEVFLTKFYNTNAESGRNSRQRNGITHL